MEDSKDPQEIKTINERLKEYFGLFDDGFPNFRVAWTEDLFEKRLVNCTSEGVSLIHPEVREVKKYSYKVGLYVLERRVPVPAVNMKELLGLKVSYEPLWFFEDHHGFPIQPVWDMIQAFVNGLQEQMFSGPKIYKMDEKDHNTAEALEEKANSLQSLLFGNETNIGDALAHDDAVGYGVRQRNDSRFKKVN